MKVSLKDGRCRSCGGELEIVDADDATMEVTCTNCYDSYLVEHDAFNDGAIHYVIGFLQERSKGDRDAP